MEKTLDKNLVIMTQIYNIIIKGKLFITKSDIHEMYSRLSDECSLDGITFCVDKKQLLSCIKNNYRLCDGVLVPKSEFILGITTGANNFLFDECYNYFKWTISCVFKSKKQLMQVNQNILAMPFANNKSVLHTLDNYRKLTIDWNGVGSEFQTKRSRFSQWSNMHDFDLCE